MYYIFKQPLYISSMYHLGWIYGYKGCLICNVCCKISQKAFKSNKHYIPSKFSPRFDIHDFNLWIHSWNASRDPDICWPLMHWMMTEPRDCRDQIQLQKRKKKSQVARSGEYGGCGKTVTFFDFKKFFTSLGSCVGGLLWSMRTCQNPDTGCRWYYFLSFSGKTDRWRLR